MLGIWRYGWPQVWRSSNEPTDTDPHTHPIVTLGLPTFEGTIFNECVIWKAETASKPTIQPLIHPAATGEVLGC